MYARRAMRIFTEQAIKEYAERHPESKVALQDWVQKVKKSEWSCFADVKKTFGKSSVSCPLKPSDSAPLC